MSRRPNPALGVRRRACALCALTVISLATGACVPKGDYEDAVRRADRNQALRQKVEAERARLDAEYSRAKARLDALAAELDAARYEAEVSTRERKAAEETVEQLRSELSRVGDHIRHYAKRNIELERVGSQLADLERDVAARLATLRDLTAKLDGLSPSSGVSIVTVDGFPAVRFAAGRAVTARGLSTEAKRAVGALGAALEDDPNKELIVLFAPRDESSRSIAKVIADAVVEKLARAAVEVLQSESTEKGTAVALVRLRTAAETEELSVRSAAPDE
jgi:hypothetical protein